MTDLTTFDQPRQNVGRDQINVGGDLHMHPAAQPRLPLQRPSRAAHFVNRERDLEQLLADLFAGRTVTLCGPGGIGKSALAAEAVWKLAPGDGPPTAFPDGVLFHSFYHRPQADLALEHIARSFGEEPWPAPLDAARRALAGRKVLLLLDGTEEADNLGAVLDVAAGCGVIVTSRRRQDARDRWQDIQPLLPDEALALLQAWGRECAADEVAARRICELTGRLPLAVRLVGRYLVEAGERAADYLAWLEGTPLEALDQGGRREQSVPLLLERSLEQVSQLARQALALAGFLALSPFNREVIAAGLELEPGPTGRVLGELVSYGLLLRREERYEISHALVHRYARERLALTGQGVEQVVNYYTCLAENQSKRGPVGYAALDEARGHILAVLTGCAARRAWEPVRSLVKAVDSYLDITGHWTEWQTVLKAGLAAAQGLGRPDDEGAFLTHLGIASSALGQVDRAIEYYQQALALHHEMGNRHGQGAVLGNLGIVYGGLGRHEQAIEYFQQALIIEEEIGDHQGQMAQLANLGSAYGELGQVERAIEQFQQALALHQEGSDWGAQGILLGNLGNAYRELGQNERAVVYLEQALTIQKEIGDRNGQAITLGNLGLAYQALSQPGLARQYSDEALAIFEEIKSPHATTVRQWLDSLGEEAG